MGSIKYPNGFGAQNLKRDCRQQLIKYVWNGGYVQGME